MGILQYPVVSTGFHGCRISRGTTQSINSSTPTVVFFDGIVYDPDTMWTAANASRIYIKFAGIYRINATWQFTNAAASANQIQYGYICKNGNSADILTISDVMPWEIVGSYGNTNHCNTDIHLEVGEFIELVVLHNTTGAKNLVVAFEYTPIMAATLLS
jgi:hypothetical protein